MYLGDLLPCAEFSSRKRNEERAHDVISRESEFISKPGCCWKKCDEGQEVPIFSICSVSNHPGID
jgi:hypothetical protein